MDEDYPSYFKEPFELDFMVHSPDVFSGDHLLDLSNPSKSHRERSIYELQRVVELTRNLMPFFKKSPKPLIIASLGGFTKEDFLTPDAIKKRYETLWDSFQKLDCSGVEIIGQTLPPFPWYFGGQLYLNLFVEPDDTVEFCKDTGMRLCLDVSHSMLACRHYKSSFHEFVEKVAPYAAHLHIADSEGVDGEGMQIEEGEIDFPALSKQLDAIPSNASFIPEIWQGHKNEEKASGSPWSDWSVFLMLKDRYRAIIVGCGNMAWEYYQAAKELSDIVEIVSIVGKHREVTQKKIIDNYSDQILFSDNYEQAVKQIKPDFSIICTHPEKMYEAQCKSILLGLPFLAEKPPSLSLAELKESDGISRP